MAIKLAYCCCVVLRFIHYHKPSLKLFHNLLEQADKKPIPAPGCVTSHTCQPDVTGDDIRTNTLDDNQYTYLWPTFAQAIHDALNGKATTFSTPIVNQAYGGPGQMDFADAAISCQHWITNETWTQYQDRRQLTRAVNLDR
ncbi:hypothetical protein NA57DRAFT_62174 [Rhizodiscina lignyota]|uniref:Uncharacterized protein n=1 Tax=Rhizodiscina lignyota TaxID=1504668 RepID=A0A9P4I3S1_9PEZI|nr:hypothetical protein NA57DRAFT_62174 [Rhizodiscina lignyota]